MPGIAKPRDNKQAYESNNSTDRKDSDTFSRGKFILIVGDWVVDEYWFLVRHHSNISGHTGTNHYRVASEPNEVVFDLCGAGHLARVLHRIQDTSSGEKYKLFGLGNWREVDTSLLENLVHSEKTGCDVARAAYYLNKKPCEDLPVITLSSLDPQSPTIRVIRQYHLEREEAGLEQINRVDWEPKFEKKKYISLQELEKNAKEKYPDRIFLPDSDQVTAIAINDLRKGVVSPELIDDLKTRYPQADWFVRSKDKDLDKKPSWLEKIQDRLILLLIGPEVAGLLNPWTSWLVKNRVTAQGVDYIEKLPGLNVVLVSDQLEIISKLFNMIEYDPVTRKDVKKHLCITGKSSYRPSLITEFAWADALFAALIHLLVVGDKKVDQKKIEEALSLADKSIWGGNFSDIDFPKNWGNPPKEKRDQYIYLSSWEEEVNEWKLARKGFGLIEKDIGGDGGKKYLEVWRGDYLLPNYIALIKKKQEIINRIGEKLRAFMRSSPKGSLSILLQADPGSGKTSMGRSLANAFGFAFESFDLTQMLQRVDLLDLFDTVVTRQANESVPVLVFVDEINAMLDNSQVYGAFLSPLEEGVYVRRGKTFSLKPCVWIFAGTQLRADKPKKGEKLSDFESRMTMRENIDINSLIKQHEDEEKPMRDEARLEQVYLGVYMIRRFFSDVQEVSLEVLDQFYRLNPASAPARKIRNWAASLENVQYGRVTRKNCESWGVKWSHPLRDQELVKLVFSP